MILKKCAILFLSSLENRVRLQETGGNYHKGFKLSLPAGNRLSKVSKMIARKLKSCHDKYTVFNFSNVGLSSDIVELTPFICSSANLKFIVLSCVQNSM